MLVYYTHSVGNVQEAEHKKARSHFDVIGLLVEIILFSWRLLPREQHQQVWFWMWWF